MTAQINLWSVLGTDCISSSDISIDMTSCCTYARKCNIKYCSTKANHSNYEPIRRLYQRVLLLIQVKAAFLFATFLKTCLARICTSEPEIQFTRINSSYPCKSACCFHPILTKIRIFRQLLTKVSYFEL